MRAAALPQGRPHLFEPPSSTPLISAGRLPDWGDSAFRQVIVLFGEGRMRIAGLVIATAVLGASSAFAQTSAPSCSLSSSAGQTGNVVKAALACVAELDGNGKQSLIVGNVDGGTGYVIIMTNTGAVRKKICWGSAGACPAVVP
jgi:hypothetical protein